MDVSPMISAAALGEELRRGSERAPAVDGKERSRMSTLKSKPLSDRQGSMTTASDPGLSLGGSRR